MQVDGENSRGFWGRTLLVLIAYAAYALAFAPLYRATGLAAAALAAVPLAMTGFLLGLRAGIVAGLLNLPLDILLLQMVGVTGWQVTVQGWPGALVDLAVGISTGWLGDLLRQLRWQSRALQAQIEERERAEAALRESQERYRALNQDLGCRVAERTAELEAANHDLRDEIAERKRMEERSAAFSNLGQRLNSALSPKDAAQIIVDVADRLIGWDACLVDLTVPGQTGLKLALCMDVVDGRRVEVNIADSVDEPTVMERRAIEHGGQLFSSEEAEALVHRRFGDTSRCSASFLFVPIRHRADTIGVLSIQSYTPRAYTQESLDTLQALADHCGGALERIRAADALRQSEARFRSLIENASDIIAILGLDGRMIYLSPSGLRGIGYQQEELAGKTILDLIPSEDIPLINAALREACQHPGITLPPAEYRIRHRDGSWHTFATVVTNLLDDPAIRGIIVNCHDITRRRQAEGEIRKLNENLQHRARELDALNKAGRAMASTLNPEEVLQLVIGEVKGLLEAEGASVLLCDPATDELAFAAAAGCGADELIGARLPVTAGIAGWVLREKRPAVVADVQQDPRFYNRIDAATGLTTRSMLAVPLTFKGAGWGVVEAINKAGSPFTASDCEMLEALASSAAVAIENARLYQAEREQSRRLQQSQMQLIHAEKMAALGRLTASIAHEINNPLQAVQSCLTLITEELEEGGNPREVQHDLEIAEAEITRISNIMHRLRDFYRPARQDVQPTDVHAVLTSVLELVNKQLQRSDVKLERAWTAEPTIIRANPDHLKQVCLNLVLNAADAMPKGGTLCIATAVQAGPASNGQSPRSSVRIDFRDTGEGISPEMLPRIFEPFFTTKERGTGLGLSISYEIVRALGGEITVESQVGIGTTFTISLPSDAG